MFTTKHLVTLNRQLAVSARGSVHKFSVFEGTVMNHRRGDGEVEYRIDKIHEPVLVLFERLERPTITMKQTSVVATQDLPAERS